MILLSNNTLLQRPKYFGNIITLCPTMAWLLPWTHYAKSLWGHNWNLVKTLFALYFIIMIQSDHNFAHVTTALLSWLVRSSDLTRNSLKFSWKIRCHAICVTSDHGTNIYFYVWSLPKRFSVNVEVSWWLFNSTINLEQKLLHNT